MSNTLDLRTIAADEQKKQIESALPGIQPGSPLVVMTDLDPQGLFGKVDVTKLTQPLRVTELEAGPSFWKVSVEASTEDSEEASCCGVCGG